MKIDPDRLSKVKNEDGTPKTVPWEDFARQKEAQKKKEDEVCDTYAPRSGEIGV